MKLFSAVAGIALVLAAIFFLRYSIEQGWLGPPIRVAIGVIVATALLVVCELKAARKYAVTANALDAAAIAILFATFYAARALWDLIPASVTFGLLILVTVLAVLLSIRHDSRFIAVLGLLGGFATPALLSTGENQPIPLFTYLLLLNAGLAWVAFKKGWPLLTILTLILTAIYQWGWVITFLDTSQLSLAMGIFLVFSVMSFVALILGRRGLERGDASVETGLVLERTGAAAALMPLLFAVYLAAVPRLAVDPALLFGFLLLLDAGLLAIAIARREELMHAIGALATLLVFAIWLGRYPSGALTMATLFTAVFVLLYPLAPMIAERLKKPFEGVAVQAIYAAPILLFVFPVLARIEPAAASPWMLFGTLYVLLALLAWRALAIPELETLLHRRVLRARRRSLVVGHSPADRAARHRGAALRDLRRLLSRRADRRAADRTSRSSRGGAPARWCSAASSCCSSSPPARERRRGCGAWPSCSRCSTPGCSSKAPPAVFRRCRSPEACCRGSCSACGGATRPPPSASCRR